MIGTGAPMLPLQVGPPTDYARGKRGVLFLILFFQVAVTAFRLVFHLDIFGALFMAVQVSIGAYAWRQDMNITYLCIFGIICMVNGVMSTIAAIIPIIIDVASLEVFKVISACLMPVADFAGALLAWVLYKDHEMERKMGERRLAEGLGFAGGHLPAGAGMFGNLFGGGHEAQPLQGGRNMFDGKGYTLGSAEQGMAQGKGAAAAYGAQAQGAAGAYGAGAMAQGAAFGKQADAATQGAQAGLAGLSDQAQAMFSGGMGSANAKAGQADVTYDPFLTRS